MKRIILALFMLSGFCFGTTAVTGHISTLGGTVDRGNFVRFWLRGCGGNQPRVNSTAVIGPSQGGVFFFDIVANSTGDIAGTIYSNRDAAGTGDGEVECGGSHTATWYGMQLFHAGKGGPEMPILAKNGDTFDISTITPITTNPVVTAPSGDSTYARLDTGNQPFTGSLQVNGNIKPDTNGTRTLGDSTHRYNGFFNTLDASGGGTLAGTFAGNPAFSGNPTFSGTPIFSNQPTFPNPFNIQALSLTEGTAPSAALGKDICYGDSTAHAIKCSFNNGSFSGIGLLGVTNTWASQQNFTLFGNAIQATGTDYKSPELTVQASTNSDLAGSLAFSASTTSATYTFGQASAHYCVISPTSDPSTTRVWISSSGATLQLTASGSITITYNYMCVNQKTF